MKPVVIIAGRKPIYNPNQNRTTIQFFFPGEGERGQIDLINGDVPRIVVNASAQVEVDRLVIERTEDRPKTKRR